MPREVNEEPVPAFPRQHRAWFDGGLPESQQVGDGIWAVVVPVPELPVRYTYCYVVVSDNGVVLVDPGWDGVAGIAPIDSALQRIGRRLSDVEGVVATHSHRDHVGLVAALRSQVGPGMWLGMHREESGPDDGDLPELFRAKESAWLDLIAAPHTERASLRIPADGVDSIVATPSADRHLADDDLLPIDGRRIRVIATPGHTLGSICLRDDDQALLITGDTLLPRISPNIGWLATGHADPLGDYLTTLARLELHDDATALPGHEWAFTGIASRARSLAAHHFERLAEVEVLVSRTCSTVWEVASALRWRRPWSSLSAFQRRIAAAEAAAHLIYLADRGRIEQRPGFLFGT